MKRDPRLRKLSDDHHHALVLARQASLAAAEDDPSACLAAWERIGQALQAELLPHFEIEERVLLPALRRAGAIALAERVLDDHRILRALAEPPPGELAERLAAFGARLTEHVRFEERVVFPEAEAKLDDAELDAIAAAAG